MTERGARRGFATRPSDPDARVRTPELAKPPHAAGEVLTARLTIDVMPELRRRIKIAAFRRGETVADMLCDLLARAVVLMAARCGSADARARSAALTHVELTWLEKRIERWIRFGRDVEKTILDRRRRVLSFAPNTVFVFVRSAANDFGTVVSRIDIVRAISPGESYQTLPFVRPGGAICCALEAGRRWSGCCARSMASRRSASMPRTPRPTIGAMSTTA
jgi:hypothetical protein